MAVVIARVAAERGLRDGDALDDVVDGWVGWLRDGASDVGNQTRHVLGVVAADRSGAGVATRAGCRGRAAPPDGPHRRQRLPDAHRARRAGLPRRPRRPDGAGPDDLGADAPRPPRRRRVRAVVPRDPARGAGRRSARPAGLVVELPRGPATSGRLDRRRGATYAVGFAPNGYVVTALQAAWSAIRHRSGRRRRRRVAHAAVHAGDDTDTVAAIAGALLGAVHGARRCPRSGWSVVHGWPGLAPTTCATSPAGWRPAAPRSPRPTASPTSSSRSPSTWSTWVRRGLRLLRPRTAAPQRSLQRVHRARALDDGTYRVWYSGDRGTPRTLVETEDWPVARSRFVAAAVSLGRPGPEEDPRRPG